jgi:hypothetical protein
MRGYIRSSPFQKTIRISPNFFLAYRIDEVPLTVAEQDVLHRIAYEYYAMTQGWSSRGYVGNWTPTPYRRMIADFDIEYINTLLNPVRGGGFWLLYVPVWLVVAFLMILPIVETSSIWIKRRSRIAGKCATCGYDLRATPDRCPECGEILKIAG